MVGLSLLAEPAVAHIAIGGAVPNDGSWAHYTVTRCAEIWDGPQMSITSWPGTALHAYVRDPWSGQPLGPTNTSSVGDGSWKQYGPLAFGQCFRISARKNENWWNWGTSNWSATLHF